MWGEPLSALMLLWKLSHLRPLVSRSLSSESISLYKLTVSSISESVKHALLATLSMLVWIPPFRSFPFARKSRCRVFGDRFPNDSPRLLSIAFPFCILSAITLVAESLVVIMSPSFFLSGKGESFDVFKPLLVTLLNFVAQRTALEVLRRPIELFLWLDVSVESTFRLSVFSNTVILPSTTFEFAILGPAPVELWSLPRISLEFFWSKNPESFISRFRISFPFSVIDAVCVVFISDVFPLPVNATLSAVRESSESFCIPCFLRNSLNRSAADFFDSNVAAVGAFRSETELPLGVDSYKCEEFRVLLSPPTEKFSGFVANEICFKFLLFLSFSRELTSSVDDTISFTSALELFALLCPPFSYKPYFNIRLWITSFFENGLSRRPFEIFRELPNSLISFVLLPFVSVNTLDLTTGFSCVTSLEEFNL